ncbi:MAG: four helix bundle protein, partial [Elusimicrobia bacterium]|nr:four helix bundle protein [Elusimicrobiota bacterium]
MEYDFEKLHVYQKSLILVERVYAATKDFPKEEQFGVTSQIRRASLSIPLNIAEGKGRYHKKVLVQFLY